MLREAKFEILTTAARSYWGQTLEEIGRHDFCHLASYSALAEQAGHGQARLFVYREGEYIMAFPILLREIPPKDAFANEHWYDVTSVYGYAGPLGNHPAIPASISRRFMEFVNEYFEEHRIVSAFSRLHPLLEQASILDDFGEVAPVGWTLSVDLKQPEEEQLNAYRRNHRQDIKHLQAMGVICEEAGIESLDAFVSMYYENMDRVGASRDYYFSRSYFEHFFNDMEGVAHLFICRHEGRPIAGGIFTLCRGIVQWYLSGSTSDFDGPPPTKLMFDVARRWAIAQGAEVIHLGGGVGGARDSLYNFKRGFTSREHIYSIWRKVVNEEVYWELTRRLAGEETPLLNNGYFPLYRSPALQTVGESVVDAAHAAGDCL